MGDPVKQFNGKVNLQAVAEQSDATASVVNAFLQAEWQPGDDWDILISDGNVILVYPSFLDAVSLETLAVCRVNADGTTTQGTRQFLCGDFVANS